MCLLIFSGVVIRDGSFLSCRFPLSCFFVIFSMCETWQILLPPELTPRNKDPSGVKTTVSFFTRPYVTRCSTEYVEHR